MILLNVIFNVIRQVVVYFIRDIFKILEINLDNFMRRLGMTLEDLLNEM